MRKIYLQRFQGANIRPPLHLDAAAAVHPSRHCLQSTTSLSFAAPQPQLHKNSPKKCFSKTTTRGSPLALTVENAANERRNLAFNAANQHCEARDENLENGNEMKMKKLVHKWPRSYKFRSRFIANGEDSIYPNFTF